MPFRERVRRVFRPSSSSSAENKPKVEYYRRHEVPPSKFRGPFDKAHQKSLAAWSFEGACVERSRSCDDLALSPCATNNRHDGCDGPDSGEAECSLDEIADSGKLLSLLSDSRRFSDTLRSDATFRVAPSSFAVSQSSTIVDLESYGSSATASVKTLVPEKAPFYDLPDDPIAQIKESIRFTSPAMYALTPRIISPCLSPRGKQLPFAPEDLTRALIAVQICA
ncbi:hypothetical protein N7510_009358 [Penicillium lagena]|uniref:uncharacterized protein n=1 Tax=Penicillium lagena TaxID=94218 RepID=UPI00253F8296|nr:uncharacterized protein N7510_009358 [Penicillium lagena]KAJ5606577.1 hypothetical protein N7510_009358 [Penicillium lagena]